MKTSVLELGNLIQGPKLTYQRGSFCFRVSIRASILIAARVRV